MAVKAPTRLNDDLFKDTTMTFGEHLEELRVCLWRAIVGLVIGFLIGLAVGRTVVLWIQAPLQGALKAFYQQKAIDDYKAEVERLAALGIQPPHAVSYVEGLVGEGFTYDEVQIEVSQLVAEMQRMYPDSFGQVELPTNPPGHPLSKIGPTQVLAAEFGDPRVKAAQLLKASEAAKGSPARRVWDMLDDDAKADILRISQQPTGDAATQTAAAEELAAVLDGLLERTDLYDQAAYGKAALGEQAQTLVANEDKSTSELRRMNRLLLEASLPQVLARSRPDMAPFLLWRAVDDDPRMRITSLSVQESFGIYMKASLLVGVVIASPWIFYQVWMFVAAGLYPHEKKYVHIFLPFSLGLFLAGAALVFAFVFEPVLNFLFGFNAWLGIDPDPRISEWLSFVLILPLGFGLAFQLPLVMLFMERIGLFTVGAYLQKWKIAIMGICILSVILTPSDPISMLLMFGPLSVLYFLGIGLCRWMPRSRSPFDA